MYMYTYTYSYLRMYLNMPNVAWICIFGYVCACTWVCSFLVDVSDFRRPRLPFLHPSLPPFPPIIHPFLTLSLPFSLVRALTFSLVSFPPLHLCLSLNICVCRSLTAWSVRLFFHVYLSVCPTVVCSLSLSLSIIPLILPLIAHERTPAHTIKNKDTHNFCFIYLHVYIYIYITYIYMYMYIYVYICVCIYIYRYVCTYICIYIYVHICISIYIYTCICIQVYTIYVYVHVSPTT